MRPRVYRIVIAAASICCSIGCAAWSTPQKLPVLPPSEAPALHVVSAIRTSPNPSDWSPLDVKVVDQRPAAERYYYPGSLRPRRWRDGLSMLPMEAITPSILDQLKASCDEHLGTGDIEAVKVELTSFQFVFDQRMKLKKESAAYFDRWLDEKESEQDEREQQRQASDERMRESDEEWRETDRQLGLEVDEPSIFEILLGDFMREAFRFIFLDMPRRTGELLYVKVKREPKAAQTPQFILNGKREGLNCQLKAKVLISSKDGKSREIPADILLHTPFEPSLSLETEMQKLVAETMTEFGRLLQE